jgi:hypothetical protein
MAKRSKSRSGEGECAQILVRFDLNDTENVRALMMARQLAGRHGSLSKIIRGFLLALADFQDTTGVELNADVVVEMFLSGLMSGGKVMPATSHFILDSEEPDIIVGTANRASADEIAYNMAMDMGNLFDE